jgi:hypothetical protein
MASERAEPAEKPRKRPVLGGVDVALALLLLFMIWVALPARWWPVDVVGTLLALLLGVSGAGLLQGRPWALRVALIAGWTALGIGASLVTALAFTVSHVAGLYGPVGQGGALILFTVTLLIVPYLVALPAVQVYLLTRPALASSGPGPEEAAGAFDDARASR